MSRDERHPATAMTSASDKCRPLRSELASDGYQAPATSWDSGKFLDATKPAASENPPACEMGSAFDGKSDTSPAFGCRRK
jgi:hypothetical protein